MELVDENSNQFFFAGDRRDVNTGVFTVTETKVGDGSTDTWNVRLVSNGITSVKLNGVTLTEGTDYSATLLPGFTTYTVSLVNTPSTGDIIEITYDATEPVLAFSLGGTANGIRSCAEASSFVEGNYAHSEGSSIVRGDYSHGEGFGTVSDADRLMQRDQLLMHMVLLLMLKAQ